MVTQLYAQLIGIGLLWVTFHCSGMCGPIMVGLVAHNYAPVPGERQRAQVTRRALGILAYQGGRAVIYGVFGALAGWLGASLDQSLRQVTGVASAVGAALLVLIALYQIFGFGLGDKANTSYAKLGRWLGRLMKRMEHIVPSRGATRMAAFGVLMAFLPCMLMFWVLSLSMTSSSPMHGALMMVLLVAMTTPVLIISGCATALAPSRLRGAGERLIPVALLVSGVWMGLIAAASNGLIEHIHLPFELFGEKYTFMLY